MTIKLCDFGWAALIEQRDIRKSVCGTPEYMPPEVMDNAGHDLSVDVWQLGILLYEIMHGKTPFPGSELEQIRDKLVSQPIVISNTLSSNTKELLKYILKKNNFNRPTAEQILNHQCFDEFRNESIKMDSEEVAMLYDVYKQNTKIHEYYHTPEFVTKVDNYLEIKKIKFIKEKLFQPEKKLKKKKTELA